MLYWNGLKNIGNSESWFAQDADSTIVEFTQAPIASVFTQMPNGGPNNFSYTFERETSFDTDGNILQTNGQDLFSRYWAKYIELVYNKDARRVTAYFTLDADDILNFKYNDVIFVEGIYYYVEKIYDAPLGQSGKVKVDLITLKFFRPNVEIPPVVDELEWQEGTEDWEDVTQDWDNI